MKRRKFIEQSTAAGAAIASLPFLYFANLSNARNHMDNQETFDVVVGKATDLIE
jgi:hypothetical protein